GAHGHRPRLAAALRDRARRRGGQLEALDRDVVRVGVALLLAGQDAHADALLDVAVAALHDALLERDRVLHGVLEDDVGGVDAPLERGAEHARQRALVDAEALAEEGGGVGPRARGARIAHGAGVSSVSRART